MVCRDTGPAPPASVQKEDAYTVKCDFCGKEVSTVKRVAMDRDYDRLTVKHEVKFACEECSKKKDEERRAADRGA